MKTKIQEETRRRTSEALYAVNQANTVYGLVFIVLAEFPGFESEKWFFKLAAQIRSSDFVSQNEAPDTMIEAAFREVADNRLPRLLCISLISIIEACLEDIAVIELAARRGLPSEEAAKEAKKIMRKSPAAYLESLNELGLTFVAGPHWQELREIVATRNVLVHRSQLVADEGYIKQAGNLARAPLGAPLVVDSSYFYDSIIAIRAMLYEILAQPDTT
ncbi:MAG TPA: hypothetical protein VGS07_29860 [Thermoanaerobaculia bacterium]|jgi:hypothetical protein|nr:hypothetical protein [Thermoanaerobaculia bacterium]